MAEDRRKEMYENPAMQYDDHGETVRGEYETSLGEKILSQAVTHQDTHQIQSSPTIYQDNEITQSSSVIGPNTSQDASSSVIGQDSIKDQSSSATGLDIRQNNQSPAVIRQRAGTKQWPSVLHQSDKDGGNVELLGVTVLSDLQTLRHDEVDDNVKQALDQFVSKKQGSEGKHYKSREMRSFYTRQDRLISAFEELSKSETSENGTNRAGNGRRLTAFYSKITFAVNLMLLGAKLAASILSSSMSIISSLVDSALDLLSGVILWWAARAMRRRDPYDYPQGRTKLEPVSIVILSVVMGLASLQLIRDSVQKIATLVSDHSALPDMELPTFIIAGSTVVVKFILWLVCQRVDSPMIQALAMDHRNDVMSNAVAIICGYLGSKNFQASTQLTGFIFTDPIGAIVISFYIIYNWWKTGSEQIKILTGHTASPDFLSKLTWIAMNHDPRITHIDTVRAYHYGNNFIVKVDIVLPDAMRLRDAHDIGESLQQKLESIPQVERAFVHVDYEFLHKPSAEHKVI